MPTRREFLKVLGVSLAGTGTGCSIVSPDYYIDVVNETDYRAEIEVDGIFHGSVELKDSSQFPVDVRWNTFSGSNIYGGSRTARITVSAKIVTEKGAKIATIEQQVRSGQYGWVGTFRFSPYMFR